MKLPRLTTIQAKLTLLNLASGLMMLVLVGGAGLVYERVAHRRETMREFASLAAVVAAQNRAALAFHNPADARQNLALLSVQPSVTLAEVRDRDGRVFARYVRPGTALVPVTDAVVGQRFVADGLEVVTPIEYDREVLGTVVLRSDLREYRQRLEAGVATFLTVLALALALAWLLSATLHRLVSGPIRQLAGVTRAVTERGDYSLRAVAAGTDEVGQLLAGFNQMLDRIQQQDAVVRQSEERFRQLAESIREVFWMTSPDKTQMLYVSPGYELIWGRTCAELYNRPASWLEAIQPDDRERVRQAALAQHDGQYDVEYRITRPDGQMRWVRDRAFPVRDEQGRIFRIAGIAEDITERKRLEQQIAEVSDRQNQHLAQDLHDGLSQHLTGTQFAAQVLADRLAEAGREEAAHARQLNALVHEGLTMTRAITRGLYPADLESGGLANALERLANGHEQVFHLPCLFDAVGPVAVADPAVALHLYRIAQEAMHNAIRHGQPTQLGITLVGNGDELVLTVADNGRGFTVGEPPDTGLGLRTMRYRAGLIGATLKIASEPGAGAHVTCTWRRPSTAERQP